MYKIIFIDIDGTLRNDNKEITERTKKAIYNVCQKGIYVVICSGRPRKYAEEVSKQALASNFIIACNGGEVYDYKKEQSIYVNNLQNENIIELYHIAEKYDIQFTMNSADKRFVNRLSNDKTYILIEEPIEELVKKYRFTQCIISSNELEKIKHLKEHIKQIDDIQIVNLSKCLVNQNVMKVKPYFLDIAHKETSKGNGIKKLCQFLKIDLKDTVAIGDSYNDLTMFDIVGHCVVMGNAPEDIKELADELTDTNNDDGVAKFLENCI